MHMLRHLLALNLLCLVSKKQNVVANYLIIYLLLLLNILLLIMRNKRDVISPFNGRMSSTFSIATNLYGQMELLNISVLFIILSAIV